MRKACFIMWAAAFFLYAAAFSFTVWPGPSAWFTAQAVGAVPKDPAAYPLALAFYYPFRILPAGMELGAMHLLAAAVMALNVALLFRFCNILFREFLAESDASSLQNAPNHSASGPAPVHKTPENAAAAVGAGIVAFLFAIDVPVRIAAGTPTGDGVALLLLLSIANLLLDFHYDAKQSEGMTALFLLGIGLWESPVFWVAFPGFVAWMLFVQSQRNGNSERSFFTILSVGVTGVTVGFILLVIQSGWGGENFNLLHSMKVLYHFYAETFLAGIPHRFWIATLSATFLPAVVAFFAVKQFQPNVRYSWAAFWFWNILNVLVAAAIICCFLQIGPTPWVLFRQGYHLPLIASLLLAFAGGALAAFALMQNATTRIDEVDEEFACPVLLRWCAFLPALAILAAGGLSLYRHWNEGDVRNAECLDCAAKWMTAHSDKAQYILCDENLYIHLRIHAKLAGKKVTCLCATVNPQTWHNPWRKIERPPFRLISAKELEKKTPEGSITAWLQSRPKDLDALLLQSQPELWEINGYPAIPHGLFYGCLPTNAPALIAENEDCWLALDKAIRRTPKNPMAKLAHDYVVREVSSVANSLGILLRDSEPKAADAAYAKALKQNPDNVSAALNRFALHLSHPEFGKMPDEVLSRLRIYLFKPELCLDLPELVRHNGQLALIEADRLMPLAATYLDNAQLLTSWMNLMRPAPSTPPRPVIRQPGAKPLSPKLTKAIAIYLDGDIKTAKKQIIALLDDGDNEPAAWVLLGEIYLTEGEFSKVYDSVLPAMRFLDQGKPSLLTEMINGMYYSSIPEPDLKKARAHFAHAFELCPEMPEAAENLLKADLALSDADLAKTDLTAILDKQPNHVLALNLQASLEMSRGKLDEAQQLLTRSITASQTGTAENMLADLWRRRGKLDTAEQHARLSVRLAPNSALYWHTLSVILLERDNKDESRRTLDYALLLDPTNERFRSTRDRYFPSEKK